MLLLVSWGYHRIHCFRAPRRSPKRRRRWVGILLLPMLMMLLLLMMMITKQLPLTVSAAAAAAFVSPVSNSHQRGDRSDIHGWDILDRGDSQQRSEPQPTMVERCPDECLTRHHHQQQQQPPPIRRLFLKTVATTMAAAATMAVTPSSSHALVVANPFVQLETVGMVPKNYFDENISIYAFVERILDGDTVRVRHVPGFSLTNQTPEPLQKRGIVDDTLIVRLYGIDCPELAKTKNQSSQPFALQAKQFTANLAFHQMVKVTFIRKDRYGRAIAMIETLPQAGFLLSGVPGLGPRDLTVELARAGLAELYTGGGSEYYTKKGDILEAIRDAKAANRGIWSLGDSRVSAAEQKRILRSASQDPAGFVVLAPAY